ncbi:sulfate adenylyltransferase subunit 1 [Flavobacterium chuncheonense]|uniref:sulfate adenylyltransferase n=1 Tax=Flavobacterium chuncheonense TaxID=2026653 RepID=A0ABW5YJY4_9FLAO
MELLKINTAGSVDDGKSTLIGRLLYDSNALTIEQEELVRRKTQEKGLEDLDFSVVTDGLIAEREQGITIDVAHIYFATNTRKFIIADSPGHVEYTRNMVTGASNSEVSIILIDARKGLLEQTHRHYFISRLLRLPGIIFCINKMDKVDYSEEVYWQITADINKMIQQWEYLEQDIAIIPISALKGDNVVQPSSNMNWYPGGTVSEKLHEFQKKPYQMEEFRMDVQQVYHVQNEEFVDYRAYAGRIASGAIAVGDTITVLPSGKKSVVKAIRKFDQLLEKATKGESIQLLLNDEIDICRGNMFVKEEKEGLFAKELTAQIVWLDEKPLQQQLKYYIQSGARVEFCKVENIGNTIAPETAISNEAVTAVQLNDIATISLKLAKPLFLDKHANNKNNGSFIMIDPKTNNTVAVGFLS